MEELKGTHAKDVEKLNLTPFVERLEQLVGEFRKALKEEAVREVSYDQIQCRTGTSGRTRRAR